MLNIKIKEGFNKVRLKSKEFNSLTPKAIRSAFYDIGKDLVSDAKRYISEPKHGRVYLTRIGKSKFRKFAGGWGESRTSLRNTRKHIASAAGEAPAKLTGKLNRSIDFTVTGTYKLDFGVNKERFDCNYAEYLEYKNLISMSGGTESARIAPRPFISRAYNENRVKLINRIKQAIQQSIGK